MISREKHKIVWLPSFSIAFIQKYKNVYILINDVSVYFHSKFIRKCSNYNRSHNVAFTCKIIEFIIIHNRAEQSYLKSNQKVI